MMDEGQDRVKAAYRGNYDRLAQVKDRYDPDNIFHVNQNIQPASGSNPWLPSRRRPVDCRPGGVVGDGLAIC